MAFDMTMATDLCDLCVKYGTDKVIWGYTPHYYTLLASRRYEVKRVLEIGICGYRDIPNNVVGASLFVWRDFFPNAEIYGIDNDGRFIFNDQQRIHTFQADAYDPTHLAAALSNFGVGPGFGFDFIVDDAVHDPEPQLKLYAMLSPWLAKSGVYAIEDVCPYKMPGGQIEHLLNRIRTLPGSLDKGLRVISTHKDERLILITG